MLTGANASLGWNSKKNLEPCKAVRDEVKKLKKIVEPCKAVRDEVNMEMLNFFASVKENFIKKTNTCERGDY